MNSDIKYRNTLIRMFFVENLGESIYNALASKVSDEGMKSIYQKLSRNEVVTAGHIEEELRKEGLAVPMLRRIILRVLAGAFFSILTHDILEKLLKKTLKKRIFRSWFNKYHKHNEGFWQLMLDHEVLQYQLLNL